MPTVRIDDARFRKIEKKAVELVIASKKPVKESMVIKALIDQCLEDITIEDIERYQRK